MTTTTLEQQKKKFRDWYEAYLMPAEADWFKLDNDGEYYHADTNLVWQAWQAAIAALPLPAMPSQSDDMISLPRGLVAAACSAIDKKRDAPVVLAKLREYAIGAEVMPEQAEPVLYQVRTRQDWVKTWSNWNECSKEQSEDYARVKELHGLYYEVRSLYSAAQAVDKLSPYGYIVYADNGNIRIWYQVKAYISAKGYAEENNCGITAMYHDNPNTSLLARIAELEAEIQKLKEGK